MLTRIETVNFFLEFARGNSENDCIIFGLGLTSMRKIRVRVICVDIVNKCDARLSMPSDKYRKIRRDL